MTFVLSFRRISFFLFVALLLFLLLAKWVSLVHLPQFPVAWDVLEDSSVAFLDVAVRCLCSLVKCA